MEFYSNTIKRERVRKCYIKFHNVKVKVTNERRTNMKTFSYTIKDAQGIHARPAGELVKAAKGFASEIKIGKGGMMVDAKKIFGIMGLGAKQGDTVEFSFNGDDEEQACSTIAAFMEANL